MTFCLWCHVHLMDEDSVYVSIFRLMAMETHRLCLICYSNIGFQSGIYFEIF